MGKTQHEKISVLICYMHLPLLISLTKLIDKASLYISISSDTVPHLLSMLSTERDPFR